MLNVFTYNMKIVREIQFTSNNELIFHAKYEFYYKA